MPLTETGRMIAWVVFLWIFFSSFLSVYLLKRYLTRLQTLGELPEGVSPPELGRTGSLKVTMFLLRRKRKSTDTEEIRDLITKGRMVEVIYPIQLLCVLSAFFWFT